MYFFKAAVLSSVLASCNFAKVEGSFDSSEVPQGGWNSEAAAQALREYCWEENCSAESFECQDEQVLQQQCDGYVASTCKVQECGQVWNGSHGGFWEHQCSCEDGVAFVDCRSQHHTHCHRYYNMGCEGVYDAPKCNEYETCKAANCAERRGLEESFNYNFIYEVDESCINLDYHVSLVKVPATTHFVMSAAPVEQSAICPQIGFESRPDEKVMFTASFDGAAVYHFGSDFKLGSILDAYHDTDPLAGKYDFMKNNCVNFAQKIWSAIGAKEDKELEDFIFSQLAEDESFVKHFESYSLGNYLWSKMLPGSAQSWLRRALKSQLSIDSNLQENEGGIRKP